MLEIKNLHKSFGNKVIFDSFSYTFGNGLYIVNGESGIGKTTLLRLIASLDTDYTGEIIGGGVENVSFSFQEYRLFEHLNALENVTVIFHDESEKNTSAASKLLNSLGISGDEQLMFPSQMSGGMKLRVSIARALSKDCPVVLLDEPTRELNIEHVENLIRILKEHAKAHTIIVVTHDLNFYKLCSDATVITL